MKTIQELIGVHFDIPAEEYHRLEGASASILRKLYQSTPAHLKLMMDEPMEPTPAMMLGTLGHAMVLEPDKPLPKIVLYPEKYPKKDGSMEKWNNNAGFCRDWIKTQKASGYTPVTQKTLDEACGASAALSRHELARPILKDCRTEVTLVTMDSTNDIAVRCRMDIVPTGNFLADCKFSHTVTEREWTKYAYSAGYHIQAALYLFVWNALVGEEWKKQDFKFIVVESKPPFDLNVFKCTPEFIAKGWEQVVRLLPVFANCVRTGVWPGSPPIERVLDVPKYAKQSD